MTRKGGASPDVCPRAPDTPLLHCLFHVFAAARLEAVLFPSPGQRSGIYCQVICGIQLLTLGRTLKHAYLLDTTELDALAVFYAIARSTNLLS